jgi:hypothetical protein
MDQSDASVLDALAADQRRGDLAAGMVVPDAADPKLQMFTVHKG